MNNPYAEKDKMQINILNDRGDIVNIVKTKLAAHEEYLWHQEAALFIINSHGQILMQRRSEHVRFNIGKFGIIANHVRVGQTMVDAALEKAREEIGISFNRNEVRYLAVQRRVEEHERRYMYFYYIKTDIDDKDIRLDPHFATEFKWFDFNELQEMMLNDDDSIVFNRTPAYIALFGELGKIVRGPNTVDYKKDKEFFLNETNDGVFLPGIIHHAGTPTKKIAILVHGTGANFYKTTYLPEIANELNHNGIDFMTFDNRGREQAAIIYKKIGEKSVRVNAGSMYENFDESLFDIMGAVEFAKEKGYTDITLVGESLGATKVLYYTKIHGDIRKIILISLVDFVLRFRDRTGFRFDKLVAKATLNVEKGKPDNMITKDYSSLKVASACRPDCNADILVLDELRDVKPLNFDGQVGVIIGTKDEMHNGISLDYMQDRIRQTLPNADTDIRLVPNAEHMFKGYEKQLARAILEIIRDFEKDDK